MNWLSLVLLAVIALFTYRGYRNGLIRELVSFAALVLAVPVAGLLYDDLFPKVNPIVDNPRLAALISFLAIMIGVVVAGQVAAHSLKKGAALLNLGAADSLAGGAFGLVKAVVLCLAVLIALVRFPDPDLTDEIDQSDVATILLDGAPGLLTMLPGHFDEAVDLFRERLAPGAAGEATDAAR